MSDQNNLSALVRTSFGKGAARKIRAKDQIPAVIYGHGTDPQHVTLPGHETMLITRRANAVITLDIEGTNQLALVKDIQRDPVKQTIEHIDLIVVRQGEKVTVEVPVHVEGESAPGTIHVVELNAVELEVEATHIPQNVVVSIEGLEEGAQISAADLVLPKGATLVSEPETLVLAVSVPQLDLTTDAVSDEDGEAAEAEGDVESIEDEERSE
ncbi:MULTISPECIES: 50S ribosomal protein L25/general stress protein Ctc [Frigoribacterium]|jgi:large subunit ribosomal protein L25|uniref:50S ribosomal protein L25/general stress protein Ctc n=1 Tax=Frigoribacterium TaxID=96492 RepID=UPI0006FAD234|nr:MULTISPECIES: 50S ribosomal protein L25/general stress protein Ctc [Frigoribacterium]KQM24298.1 50S ribosomal protein L25 [Frigoribacterium sp. Leaf8]MBD8139953.1 50S ribosomal protein L25/general stress protein Ctc [Frigoribacterium sp. CFBP 13605]MBD8484388.1 50S ribosomal protein L25/general stress protein Ctc [Frigoribacterium sp. CFBP 8759]NQW88286.1 50S ribosomal protein L25/general stress protein Ctc [Frigoribacterium sp. VKM Ac-2860]NQX08905.1 50S ribosomal protein L25/general stres